MKDTHQQQLDYLIKEKDYSAAESFLSSIKSEYPEDLNYLYVLVNVSRKLGQLEKAEKICQDAILKYPDSSQLNFELGIIYQTKKEFRKAIEFLHTAVNTTEDISTLNMVDMLNSLALTYKYDGDYVNAKKYYNSAIEVLGQGIYEDIKNHPLQFTNLDGRDFNYTGNNKEGWVDLALRIVNNNAISDGVKSIRFLTGETAQKIVQSNPMMGVALYDDKEFNRYILPAYFSSFYLSLKLHLYYSNLYNNIGVLFSETGKLEEAKRCYEESIRFIPKGIEYMNPFINLKRTQKRQNLK